MQIKPAVHHNAQKKNQYQPADQVKEPRGLFQEPAGDEIGQKIGKRHFGRNLKKGCFNSNEDKFLLGEGEIGPVPQKLYGRKKKHAKNPENDMQENFLHGPKIAKKENICAYIRPITLSG
jgi:hypothetical protein